MGYIFDVGVITYHHNYSLPRFLRPATHRSSTRLGIVLLEGTYLATRFEEEDTVNLYYIGSFFAEMYYDPQANFLHYGRTDAYQQTWNRWQRT